MTVLDVLFVGTLGIWSQKRPTTQSVWWYWPEVWELIQEALLPLHHCWPVQRLRNQVSAKISVGK